VRAAAGGLEEARGGVDGGGQVRVSGWRAADDARPVQRACRPPEAPRCGHFVGMRATAVAAVANAVPELRRGTQPAIGTVRPAGGELPELRLRLPSTSSMAIRAQGPSARGSGPDQPPAPVVPLSGTGFLPSAG
jgi:hypothetical protein